MLFVFCYLDHLVANRMAPSKYSNLSGTRWSSCFQVILYHISAAYIWCLCGPQIFSQCRIKLTCLTIAVYDTRCYFNVRSKADISQLNLRHGTDN